MPTVILNTGNPYECAAKVITLSRTYTLEFMGTYKCAQDGYKMPIYCWHVTEGKGDSKISYPVTTEGVIDWLDHKCENAYRKGTWKHYPSQVN